MRKLTFLTRVILAGTTLTFLTVGSMSMSAAIIWTGPLINYNQPSPDPTQAPNQDRLTPDMWLTRAASKGLFNAFYETNATALSPTNTEWAFGALTNYGSLNFTNWLAWLNGKSPTTLVGQPAVVHLISDDVYLSIQFTAWAAGGSGGFAYERSTPAPVSLAVTNFSGGQFSFNYNTEAGFTYVIQCSSNLVNWVPLATNSAAGASLLFSNAVSSIGAQFYRVDQLTDF
jgi:hypothetical protein